MDRDLCSNFASAFSLLFLLILNAPNAGAEGRPTYPPSRHENDEGKLTPLSPRAHPYALAAGSGIVNVRFSVRILGKKDSATTVYLRRSGVQESIAMNDQGVNGDHVAGDNIFGASIPIDTSPLASDSCLNYEAFINTEGTEVVSAPLQLCVSSLPVRMSKSNTDKPVVFADGSKAVADEILVTARLGIKSAAMQALAANINATIVGSIPPLNLFQLKLSGPATEAQLTALIEQLNARPEVQEASVNAFGTFSSSDPNFSSQHGLQLIRAQDVWATGATGSGVTVVVIDSGLSLSHPDLVSSWTCQLPGNPTLVACTDTVGHGTQVAGVISAVTDNAIGIAGIAYGSNIHSIKVNSTPNPNDPTHPFVLLADMQAAFVDAASYVASHGSASIVNASFTVQVSNITSVSALCQSINSVVTSGAIVVNAAGNDNSNGYFYPGRCNINEPSGQPHAGQNEALTLKNRFISVANSVSLPSSDCLVNGTATQNTVDTRCEGYVNASALRIYGSNYGAWVDIAAPGTRIYTTDNTGGYSTPTGTSFSSPMVASAAAILKSCGVPLDQIESTLKNSANVTVTFPDASSAPRLDIYRALQSRNRTPTALAISNSSLVSNLDTSAGAEVGVLTTTDLDTCDKWTYSIVGGADAGSFSIGGAAADRLRLTAGVLNSAIKSSYAVTLRVTDYFGATFDQPITVTVTSVNNPPTISNQTFRINNGSTNGTAVGTVLASDPDSGNVLSYSITAGNTSSAFSLNPTTGALSVSNSAALAANPTFSLTVTVTDGGGLSAAATVTVNVNKAPTISNQTFSVNENTANGTSVGAVVASDAGDTLSYSIIAGNTSGAFSINSSTGVISVSNSAALVYATNPTFGLTVKVTDAGGLTASATVTVNVNAPGAPANNAPVIANQTFAINDGSANGTVVGPVVASDPDAGNTLSYSITGGNTGNAFNMNASTGMLSVSNNVAVSYASNPTFALTVRVTDNGGLSTTATVTVNVNAPATNPGTNPPQTGGGDKKEGGGGCSVLPAGAKPDSSLLLAVFVILAYRLRRHQS